MSVLMPRYPIYIPSKGRSERCLTARRLLEDDVPFSLVVEPGEAGAYAARFGSEHVLALPFANAGSVIPARNWIKEHATERGATRHWQLDDNVERFYRRWKAQRWNCSSAVALRVCEDLADRYENVAVAGLNYGMFIPEAKRFRPLARNVHVYSCCLILNSLPYRWRGRYNEDTDYCLQALSGGWCTILLNAFLAQKVGTMQMRGGNTTELYAGDGRLKMARALERLWPGVVEVRRRFNRPQHVIKFTWSHFDTPLRLKPDVDLARLPAIDEYGLELRQKREIRTPRIRELVADRLVTLGSSPAEISREP